MIPQSESLPYGVDDAEIFALLLATRNVLAAGDTGAGALSGGVAGVVTLQDCGHCGIWCDGVYLRAVYASGAGASRCVDGEMPRLVWERRGISRTQSVSGDLYLCSRRRDRETAP